VPLRSPLRPVLPGMLSCSCYRAASFFPVPTQSLGVVERADAGQRAEAEAADPQSAGGFVPPSPSFLLLKQQQSFLRSEQHAHTQIYQHVQ
jgi:hypothetical protein